MKARWLAMPLFVALASAAGGCSVHLRPGSGRPPSRGMTAVRVAGPIDLRAGTADAMGRSVEVSPFDIDLRYQEFTDAAVDRLHHELSSQGAQIVAGAPKLLEITVMYVDILRSAGSFSCLVDYRVHLGNGTVRGLQARASSWSYDESCQLAVSNVAAETMRDEDVARYVAQ